MSKAKTKEQALKLRSQLKGKKPKFRRQESWRYKRVSKVWRRPDGIDSKMRRKVKGWPAQAEIGYRGPRKARSLHPSGYEEVLVRNVDDLARVDPNAQAIRIAHTVGMKKRADIYVRAGEKHIHILNPLPVEEPGAEEVTAEAQTDETAKDDQTNAVKETEATSEADTANEPREKEPGRENEA